MPDGSPDANSSAARSSARRRDGPNADERQPRVLVVDDHKSMCRLVKQRLEREGHEVCIAHSVSQGKRALEQPFDVALLDVELPDGQGFELVEELRQRNDSPISVVMITGSPTRDALQHSLNRGILEVLFKPFRYSDIRDAVARALEAKRRWDNRVAVLEGRSPQPGKAVSSTELPEADIHRLTQALVQRYGLTERERETLELILRGLQNIEIAAMLDISGNTVKYHVRNLLTKLGMESRTELFRSLLNPSE